MVTSIDLLSSGRGGNTCPLPVFHRKERFVHPETSSPISHDEFFNGRLAFRQPTEGYRFSMDAVLVAHFLVPGRAARILDLGCGCGIIGQILAYRHADVHITGLELQEELARLAGENATENGFAHRVGVVCGDARAIGDLFPAESFDAVISNPPYRRAGSGRLNDNIQAARARHELDGSLDDFVRAAAYAVKNRGKTVFIYPATRCNPLLIALHRHRLTLKRLQPLYSYPGATSARLVLIEAAKNGGEQLELLPPLFLYEYRNGPYSRELQALYREEPCWRP
ncbi:MAG: tRNA1(Val) (adenine(37)-N6)-methyltransferase [Desulfobulbus sp.]|jgi:tRNA1Val (adenine37-N6)-methyltransferase